MLTTSVVLTCFFAQGNPLLASCFLSVCQLMRLAACFGQNSLAGLNNLVGFQGGLIVQNNGALTNLNTFRTLQAVGSVSITGNALVSIAGLCGLRSAACMRRSALNVTLAAP